MCRCAINNRNDTLFVHGDSFSSHLFCFYTCCLSLSLSVSFSLSLSLSLFLSLSLPLSLSLFMYPSILLPIYTGLPLLSTLFLPPSQCWLRTFRSVHGHRHGYTSGKITQGFKYILMTSVIQFNAFHLLPQYEQEGQVDPLKYLCDMRTDRGGTIQTPVSVLYLVTFVTAII